MRPVSSQTAETDAPIRLLLVDHDVVLHGLEHLFRSDAPDMQVVGKSNDGEYACKLTRELNPDVVLLDVDLPAVNASTVLPRLIENGKSRVLVYTAVRDSNAHCDAILRGARGVFHKSTHAQLLVKAVRCVMAGELWLDRASIGQVVVSLLEGTRARSTTRNDPGVSKLTRREREIVVAMCATAGGPAKRVAASLNISDHTLRNHLSAIYEKLGVANRAELCSLSTQQRMGSVGPHM